MKTATATMMCTYYYYYYIYAAPYEFALFKTCKYFLDDSPTRAVSENEQSKKKKTTKIHSGKSIALAGYFSIRFVNHA